MHYKNLVRGIVDEIYVDMQKSPTNFGDQRIFDEVSGNYLLYQNSWINKKKFMVVFYTLKFAIQKKSGCITMELKES